MKLRQYYVYILTSRPKKGTLYIGITNDLVKRTHQHKQKSITSFTSKYQIDQLVYYEIHDSAESTITREKQLKKWNRQWKIELIEKDNPNWCDLYLDIA